MKNYFIKSHERDGTCYHEFYRGKWKNNDFWNESSICIDDDDMTARFVELIRKYVPSYDYYGETEITLKQWQQIKNEGLLTADKTADIINQAENWMAETFKEHKVFTILGI